VSCPWQGSCEASLSCGGSLCSVPSSGRGASCAARHVRHWLFPTTERGRRQTPPVPLAPLRVLPGPGSQPSPNVAPVATPRHLQPGTWRLLPAPRFQTRGTRAVIGVGLMDLDRTCGGSYPSPDIFSRPKTDHLSRCTLFSTSSRYLDQSPVEGQARVGSQVTSLG
jgi:hypothetical protein